MIKSEYRGLPRRIEAKLEDGDDTPDLDEYTQLASDIAAVLSDMVLNFANNRKILTGKDSNQFKLIAKNLNMSATRLDEMAYALGEMKDGREVSLEPKK